MGEASAKAQGLKQFITSGNGDFYEEVENNDLAEDSKFLVKAAQLPASQVGVIDVPFRGRKLKVSGDRSYADWSTSITNDHTFGLRVALEKWSELIQNHNFALGANELSQYFGTAIVRQLDRDANQIRAYKFNGI